MEFKFNQQERDALKGLPHTPRLLYFEAIRPYMDYSTGIVGIKRGISYQSLTEELYVEPQRGNTGGSPTRAQMRRAIKTLERAGLIAIQSERKRLILKCLLATWDFCGQTLPVIDATHKHDTRITSENIYKTSGYNNNDQKADTVKNTLPVTPPETGINIIFLRHAFEKFWLIYPLKQSRTKAWEIFQALSPTPELFQSMLDGLTKQIEHYNQAMAKGQWMPNWKYAANWLIQHCWEDSLFETQGNDHASSQKQQQTNSADLLWESCKNAFTGDGNTENTDNSSIIEFKKYQHSTY